MDSERVASVNDMVRERVPGLRAKYVFTKGVNDLLAKEAKRRTRVKLEVIEELFQTISKTEIDPGDDPHGERDFGVFYFLGQKFFWKIDYYDQSFESFECPYEGNPIRLLTVMLADEY